MKIVHKLSNLKINSKIIRGIKCFSVQLGFMATCIVSGGYFSSIVHLGFTNVNNTIKNDYYELVYDSDKLMQPAYNDNYKNIDYDAMEKVKVLTLDMSEIHDLYYLKYYTNLECLQIYNAQQLTDLNIDEINLCSAKDINLLFDKNIVIKKMSDHFDMSRFIHKSRITRVDFFNTLANNEVDNLLFIEYLTNYSGCNIDIYKYEPLNEKINQIVNSLNLKEGSGNVLNIIEVINYVLNEIKYDEEVLENNIDTDKSKIKVIQYNEKSISSIFDKENEQYGNGVCINYADLSELIFLKCGFEVYSIHGFYDNVPHAWNAIEFHGDYFYIDLTYLDNTDNYKISLNNYNNNSTDDNLVNLANVMFITPDNLNYKATDKYQDYYRTIPLSVEKNKTYGTNTIKYNEYIIGGIYGFTVYLLISGYMIISYIIENKKQNEIEEVQDDELGKINKL